MASRRWPGGELVELRAPGVLQLFFAADPAELAPLQAEAHRRDLAELEAIKEGDTGEGSRGPWLALEAGIGASRGAAELWQELARRHPEVDSAGMATAAEPLPAELPLSGGRQGATVRVHPLLTATVTVPPAYLHREEGRLATWRALGLTLPSSQRERIPIPAFLVEHPGAGLILTDTGFHPSVAVEGLGRLAGLIFKDLEMASEQAVPGLMRELGFDPDDVRTVVMTHLHVGHASGISQFPHATFVLSEAEWRAAAAGGPRQGYLRQSFDHAFDYRLLDFDDAGADSFATFGRAFDLFGDGSVRLLFTPGHTAGHLSVELRTTGRETLLAGDAVFTMRSLREGLLPYSTDDEHLARRSLHEAQLYAERTPSAVIVPGHDMARWNGLEAVI